MSEPMTPEPHQRTPQDVLKYWRDKLHEHRYSEESCRKHGMPDQAKWHEGQADAIDHFLLDLEQIILRQPSMGYTLYDVPVRDHLVNPPKP